MGEVCLSELKIGDSCMVQSVDIEENLCRLVDLGLIEGTVIRCAYRAPSGTPIAFWISGSLIALRRDVCRMIKGTRCG